MASPIATHEPLPQGKGEAAREAGIAPRVATAHCQTRQIEWQIVSGNQVAGITIGNGKGLAAMVGLDFAITPRVFARGDVRYLEWKSDIGWTAAAPAREADMDALIYGLSIGMRF